MITDSEASTKEPQRRYRNEAEGAVEAGRGRVPELL
jgi:hypothetical protein